MTFASPLWLLLLLPLLLLIRRKRQENALLLPHPDSNQADISWRTRFRAYLPYLRWLVLGLFIVALARPQRKWEEQKVKADALDIMLCLDISPSMLSRDFDPDRLTVCKNLASAFAGKRPYDRVGLVAFSAEAFTQCPLVTDKRVVQGFIKELTIGRLEDGTAIGMGLATAVNRLKESPAKSKLVVLITDGENNAGYITPMQAADIAKTFGVKVYTVGIGTEGVVMSPAQRNPDGSYTFAPRYMTFDTRLLEEMAAATGGKFYRAFSERDLEAIYDEIDRLEKTRIEISTVKKSADYYQYVLAAGAVILLVEILSTWVWLRSITP